MAQDNSLGNLILADPVLSGLTVHLFKNDIPDEGTIDPTTLQECTFPGYQARCADAWENAVEQASGMITRVTKSLDFRVTAAGPTELAYGAYVTVLMGLVPKVLDVFRFDKPAPMSAVGNNKLVLICLNVVNQDDLATPT